MKSEEELSKFLKKHRVYREFIKRIKSHYFMCPSLDYYCKKIIVEGNEHISAGFNWDESPKGIDFWAKLSKKWESWKQ